MENDGQKLFVFTVNGNPMAGPLSVYAKLWEHNYYFGDADLSETVLTWDNTSDPITWPVKVIRHAMTEDDRIPYDISVKGFQESVTVLIDGRS
jgi:hypothetical protein